MGFFSLSSGKAEKKILKILLILYKNIISRFRKIIL